MTDMSEPPIYRYDVAFEATEIDQGRSIVRLALNREGTASAPSTTFFLEPKEDMTPEATELLARFLSEYIARFGIVLPNEGEPQGAEETSEQA
jgi:hypothetical protein